MIVKKMWFLNILYLFLVTCTCVRDSGFVHLRAMLEDLMAGVWELPNMSVENHNGVL